QRLHPLLVADQDALDVGLEGDLRDRLDDLLGGAVPAHRIYGDRRHRFGVAEVRRGSERVLARAEDQVPFQSPTIGTHGTDGLPNCTDRVWWMSCRRNVDVLGT